MITIDELLTRGVDQIYPSKKELEKVLKSGKKLKLYQGFDPTGIELHIGHMVGLRKLRQWQDLGHHVIFLIGDFTGMVGDPTGKDKTRIRLSREQVLENAKTYQEQASKILRFDGENKVEVKFNSSWLGKMSGNEFMELTSLISYNQIIEREMFQNRIQRNESISVIELLYPILQGYDSVEMDVDLEIGGSDQMFNMMVGRELMLKLKGKNKFVMTTPLLTDAQGRKIGKTEGNVIALTDKPSDLFAKIMALPDDIIIKALEYLTDIPMEKIKQIDTVFQKGENPVVYKKLLAFEITKQLNSEKDAIGAQEQFEKTVQQKEIPEDIASFEWTKGGSLIELLTEANMVESKSEAKRLIEQGGIAIDEEIIRNPNAPFSGTDGSIIRVGKRRFLKVKLIA